MKKARPLWVVVDIEGWRVLDVPVCDNRDAAVDLCQPKLGQRVVKYTPVEKRGETT